MKRLLIALCITLPALPLAACVDEGYDWGPYAGSPYPYDGYYDDYYGPIYDGYWGDDGFFYFRGSEHDQHFRRGDSAHFRRGSVPEGHFHPMQGSMMPGPGMHTRHFGGSAPNGDHGHH